MTTEIKNTSSISKESKLTSDKLTEGQTKWLARTWGEVKDTKNPYADLRSKMTDSGLFDFLSKYNTNNLELKHLIDSALGVSESDAKLRVGELKRIIESVKDKTSYADMRVELSAILGFRVVYEMTNPEIDVFINDARNEYSRISKPKNKTEDSNNEVAVDKFSGDSADLSSTTSTKNRELYDSVSDLVEGKLTVDANDKVRYASGMSVYNRSKDEVQGAGGRFATNNELEAIASRADFIRDNLPNSPGSEPPIEVSSSSTDGNDSNIGTEIKAESASNDKPLSISFVDQSHDAEILARDMAEARRRDEMNHTGEGNGRILRTFKRFMRGIWMGEHGIMGYYYLERYKREALEQIEQSGDILLHESDDADARERARQATLDRFQSLYEESIHTEAGESRAELGEDSEFSHSVKDLIRSYVDGDITSPEALEEEKNRLLATLSEAGDSDLIGEGRVRIDNLVAVADQVRAMVDHGESIERVLAGMKIYSGESRSSVRSEAHLSKTEKVIDKLQRTRLGGLVSPEALGGAAAIALWASRVGSNSLLKVLGVTAIPGTFAAILAPIRERKRLKEERAIHAREMALGKTHEPGRGREQIEETRYDTEAAQSLIDRLNSLLVDEDTTPDQIQQAFESIATVEARIRMSDSRSIDLVSYSSPTSVEVERRELDEARALAKVRLQSKFGDMPDNYLQNLGITSDMTLNQALDRFTDAVDALEAGISDRDRAYRSLRRRRTLKMASVSGAVAATASILAQETVAFGSDKYDGLFEHMAKGQAPSSSGSQTILEGLFHGQDASSAVQYTPVSSTYDPHDFSGHSGALELTSGYGVISNPDGTLSLTGPKGFAQIDGLTLDSNGNLSSSSIDLLHSHNVSVSDTGAFVSNTVVTPGEGTKVVSIDDYIDKNRGEFTHISRQFWADNDTPVFDKNELRTHWGFGGNGVDSNGNYQLSVAAMTENGSYHSGDSISWAQSAAEGKLKMAISATKDTQTNVFMVDIKPDGTIDVPKDSLGANFFTTNAEGHAEFKGAFAEIVDVHGDVSGTTQVVPISTLVGDNSVGAIEIPSPDVITTTEEFIPHLQITPPPIETIIDTPAREVVGYGVPGVVGRRTLESLSRSRSRNRYGMYGYNAEQKMTNEELSRIKRGMSETILDNPTAVLEPRRELDRFKGYIRSRDGEAHLKEVQDIVKNTKELATISDGVETMVTIPVGAAYESENIYKTLSLYSKQDAESLKKTVLVLNVNKLDSVDGDADLRKKAQKTLDEIARARRDFPELRIAVFERTYSEQEVKKTKGVIGYAARDLVDTALIAIQSSMESGILSDSSRIVVQRHDADMLGMSRHFLRKLQETARRFSGVDIFKGGTHLGIDQVKKNPVWGVVDTIFHLSAVRAATSGAVHTGGANFAVRAETLAAVGGLGDFNDSEFGSGAGSDDVMLGRRIATARGAMTQSVKQYTASSYGASSSAGSATALSTGRILQYVPGMSIDTSAERFLPMYLRGEWWQEAWNPTTGSFSKGAGGYGARDSGGVGNRKSENFGLISREGFKRLERVISQDFSNMPEVDRARVLSIFFKNTPGAYSIGENSDGTVQFNLTSVGRKYVRKVMKGFAERKVVGAYGDGEGRGSLGGPSFMVRPAV